MEKEYEWQKMSPSQLRKVTEDCPELGNKIREAIESDKMIEAMTEKELAIGFDYPIEKLIEYANNTMDATEKRELELKMSANMILRERAKDIVGVVQSFKIKNINDYIKWLR